MFLSYLKCAKCDFWHYKLAWGLKDRRVTLSESVRCREKIGDKKDQNARNRKPSCGDLVHRNIILFHPHFCLSVPNSWWRECAVCVYTQSGLTGLHVASFCGNPTLVEHLLSHGADVNSRGAFGETPLHLAAVGSPAVVTLLLNAGANVNDSAQVSHCVRVVVVHLCQRCLRSDHK